MTQTLLIDRTPDGVVTLTFNRPQARNALDFATMRLFASTVESLMKDDELRAVILTGADGNFCSGGDLVELSGYPSEDDARGFISLMGDALLHLERLPVPVIAAINGYALGGGSEIAVACDIRIVDEAARMGFVQIRMGLTPGWGAGQRLLRIVGYSRAMLMLLQGETMRADDLLSAGLVQSVTERGAALPHALTLAHHIAKQPPDVVRAIKALLQAGRTQPYEEALTTEREIFPPLWAADAHLRAVKDFLNKNRKP